MLIIILVAKKINISAMIENLKISIETRIKNAEHAKSKAFVELQDVEKSVENLGDEIKKMLGDAENNAEIIGKKILEDAEKQIAGIELNSKKIIDAEEKSLTSKLTKKASLTSVELAKSQIKNTLANNPSLHARYINESIDSLDRLNF